VLRQLGLVVFFAGAGTAAGASLPRIPLSTLLLFLALGALLTAISSFVVLWWGYRRMKLSLNTLGGLLAGTQTQSSLLDFATKQSGNELPAHSYAVVYPLATVLKIVLAQVLLVRFL
jgi:putative transport protein